MRIQLNKYLIYSFFIVILFAIHGCNTGIESTRAIKMSKSEKKELQPTEEETFALQFSSLKLKDWKIGKNFFVADSKAFLILKGDSNPKDSTLTGIILSYDGIESSPTAGGNTVCYIKFVDNNSGKRYYYNTGKNEKISLENIDGLDIPAMIDIDMVENIKVLLKGKELWIRTQLWYDSESNPKEGRKLVPVFINDVANGNMYFPIRIDFSEKDCDTFSSIYMNVKTSTGIGAESRTFPSLFYLNDPRSKYPSISDEVWKLIQNGRVAVGMTKDECRLSLGNPPDVDAGHNWNNTIDIWRYKDGTFLQFQDGLLVNFRH